MYKKYKIPIEPINQGINARYDNHFGHCLFSNTGTTLTQSITTLSSTGTVDVNRTHDLLITNQSINL